MKKFLPANFELERYGLHCRLVNEYDAEFIVKLRTNPELTRYFHRIENDVEKQKKWIRNYKEREARGTDYYFVFEFRGVRVGMNRVYDIKEDGTFICGSLVFDKSPYKMAAMASLLIVREIAFEMLELKEEVDYIGTHQDNKALVVCKEKIGFVNTGIRQDALGPFVTARLSKENFYSHKTKIEHFLLK